MSSEQQYITLYEQHADLIARHCSAVLNAPRAEAAAAFRREGFPTKRNERYKYTDVAAAFAPNFGLNLNRVAIPIEPYATYRCPVGRLADTSYFIVNDSFCPPPARAAQSLPEGVIISSLNAISTEQPQLVARYYAQLADTSDGITALNTMLAQDGLFVYIPAGVKMPDPIQLVTVAYANVDFMNNRRVVIVLEEEAEATFVFCDHATEGKHFLNTQVTEVYVGRKAKLNLYQLEETHQDYTLFNNLYLRQDAQSHVIINDLMLHGGLTRNLLHLALAGQKATIECYGCVVGTDQQHIDNHAVIDHQVPDCNSQILYKYLLDDRAVGAFVGHVLVRKDAQHTLSEETSANICLSKEARIYTRPMLEIYADDVKCNHGATTGRLDESALFYMQQRGVPQAEARILLQHAFINDIINRISVDSLRDHLSEVVERRFRGQPAKCADGHCCHCSSL